MYFDRNVQRDLEEASEKLLNVDKKFLLQLGFDENPHLYPESYKRNVTLPVIVTYAKSGQEEQAVSFVRNIASLLPQHVTLMYNIGLQTYELFLVSYLGILGIFLLNTCSMWTEE